MKIANIKKFFYSIQNCIKISSKQEEKESSVSRVSYWTIPMVFTINICILVRDCISITYATQRQGHQDTNPYTKTDRDREAKAIQRCAFQSDLRAIP